MLSTDAIGRFQEYAGLKKTKILDNETIAKLEEPRCGMRDPSFEKRAKRYVHQGTKWHKRVSVNKNLLKHVYYCEKYKLEQMILW